jgi:hypothetical protein
MEPYFYIPADNGKLAIMLTPNYPPGLPCCRVTSSESSHLLLLLLLLPVIPAAMTHSLSAAPNLHLTFHEQVAICNQVPVPNPHEALTIGTRCLPPPPPPPPFASQRHMQPACVQDGRPTQRCCCARRRECCRDARISADYADSFLFCCLSTSCVACASAHSNRRA